MRYFRYAFLGLIAIVLVTLSVANRQMVTLNLLPEELVTLIGINLSVSVPLFIVFFGTIIIGLLIGFAWEWLREHKHRSMANVVKRDKDRLEREVSKLKVDKARNEGDEVLALLDN